MTPTMAQRWLRSPATAVLLATAALLVLLWHLDYQLDRAHIDLDVYRFAVREWAAGGDMYGPLPQTDGGTGLSLPFIYPPFAVLPAIPFALVGWATAYVLLYWLSMGCVFATLYLVTRRMLPSSDRRTGLLVATTGTPLALALEPVRDTLEFGQINLLLMGIVAFDCLTRWPRWPRGLGIGIAAAIKLTPAVFVLYFLVRRDTRAAALSVLSAVAATAIGFAVDAAGSLEYWLGGFAGAAGISGSTYRTNQTVQAAFARFEVPEPWLTVVVLTVVAVLLVLVVLGMRRTSDPVALVLCALLSLLAAPTAWSHHWVWIVPGLLALTIATARRVRRLALSAGPLLTATAATAAIFAVGPFHHLPGNDDWTPSPVDLETTWSPLQHLVGNSYVLLAIAGIGTAAVAALLVSSPAGEPSLPRRRPGSDPSSNSTNP